MIQWNLAQLSSSLGGGNVCETYQIFATPAHSHGKNLMQIRVCRQTTALRMAATGLHAVAKDGASAAISRRASPASIFAKEDKFGAHNYKPVRVLSQM